MRIFRYDKVSSTQVIARELLTRSELPFTVIARTQTGGYGRYNRKWFSPPGGLWLTSALKLPDCRGSVLSLLLGIELCDILQPYFESARTHSHELGLAVPNDVLVKPSPNSIDSLRITLPDSTSYTPKFLKLAGLLVQKSGRATLIGIGINVNNTCKDMRGVGIEAVSLRELLNSDVNLEELTGKILKVLHELPTKLRDFKSHELLARFNCRDILVGHEVRVNTDDKVQLTGYYRGLEGFTIKLEVRGKVIYVPLERIVKLERF